MPGGITGPPSQGGTQIQRPDSPGWGLDARLAILFCKNYCCEIQRYENGMFNFKKDLVEYSKEMYGWKNGCFAKDNNDNDDVFSPQDLNNM